LISCTQSGPAGGFDARVGMHGGTNPLLKVLVTGIWQIYRLARSGGNGQIAAVGAHL